MPPLLLQVDTSLSPLQAVAQGAGEGNPVGQRVAHILSIPAAAAAERGPHAAEGARALLLPLLTQLAFDDDPDIKHATAEVLGILGDSHEGAAGDGGRARGQPSWAATEWGV